VDKRLAAARLEAAEGPPREREQVPADTTFSGSTTLKKLRLLVHSVQFAVVPALLTTTETLPMLALPVPKMFVLDFVLSQCPPKFEKVNEVQLKLASRQSSWNTPNFVRRSYKPGLRLADVDTGASISNAGNNRMNRGFPIASSAAAKLLPPL